jgi:hypothetical protein
MQGQKPKLEARSSEDVRKDSGDVETVRGTPIAWFVVVGVAFLLAIL